jgi:NAD(P)-dependent dehydrogenase (short-subunit alcohol dehydrogenase family)
MAPPLGSKTAQGYELQLGTNVLGHYLFTKLLLPTLEKTAQQLPNQGYNVVRIINTSSNGHVGAPAGGFKFEDPNGINSKWTLYGQSKCEALSGLCGLGRSGLTLSLSACPGCNLVHADELARRYGDKGISAHSLNPGAISTDLQRHSGFFERTLLRPILNPVELGCLTQLYAGLMPEAGKSEHNGTYYIPWGREGIKRPDTQDKEVASKL